MEERDSAMEAGSAGMVAWIVAMEGGSSAKVAWIEAERLRR